MDNVLFDKAQTVLMQYPAGDPRTAYSIPSSVEHVGASAFSDCGALTQVDIPESVTGIGEELFYESDNVIVYGFAGSNAESYAAENDIPFVALTLGDADGDGDADAVDARWVLQAAAGIRTLESPALAAADANGDNTVDAVDARWILQAAAGLRTLGAIADAGRLEFSDLEFSN